MEMQFNKTVYPCINVIAEQTLTQELTQELKLTEEMPDIGRILGCWGQIIVRGKEWMSGGMNVSGGVMAWVLYTPEDSATARSAEIWMPFQLKWNLPMTQHDGIIHVKPYIKSMDCRSTAARRLMMRAVIAVTGEAMEQKNMEVFVPVAVPEDVQLLCNSYPMEISQEAGEKPFSIEEDIVIPGIAKIIRYEICPEIAEHKVMAGRLVFRGMCKIHMLTEMADGTIQGRDTDASFSQFTDLDRDYGTNASATMNVILTGAEIDIDEAGKTSIKCGFTAQYTIFDRVMVEVVEDAYSPNRIVKASMSELSAPARLDILTEEIPYAHTMQAEGQTVLDSAVFSSNPLTVRDGDVMESECQMQYHLLYVDMNGELQSASERGEVRWQWASDSENTLRQFILPRRPVVLLDSGSAAISGSFKVDTSVIAEKGIPMVTGLELGETIEPDPQRPALILKRPGEKNLWEIAKECGSTVDAICKANKIEKEPLDDSVLLIPVL